MKPEMAKVVTYAVSLGVSDVKVISPDMVPVDDRFPSYCKEPGCPGYGISMSCPPHVGGPSWFRNYLKAFDSVLIFKFDVPYAVLLTDERHDVTRLIHETVAAIETYAKHNGHLRAAGFAGGSCKRLFCNHHLECRVLSGNGSCRNPNVARPSMSGMGVDFQRLCRIAGWGDNLWVTVGSEAETDSMGMMVGMVLLGAPS